MVSENLPLTVGQENLSNSEVSELSENQKYSLCLELGLWEKLLNDIKDQDFLDGLEDMNFLRAAIDRVEALSAKLIKNGVLNVSPNAYLSSEYDDFDNDAEKVEKMVLDLAKVIKSENFLEEFLNSSSKEDGLLKLEKIKTEVYMACVDFHKRNAHRIEIEGELKIWEFFAEKFGEDDDILLIQDLINIGTSDNPNALFATNSPVLCQIGETILLLEDLLETDGTVRPDCYKILSKLKDLFDKKSLVVEKLLKGRIDLLDAATSKFHEKWEDSFSAEKINYLPSRILKHMMAK